MKKVQEETMVFSAHTAEHKEGVLFSAGHSFNSSFMSFDQALWSTHCLGEKKKKKIKLKASFTAIRKTKAVKKDTGHICFLYPPLLGCWYQKALYTNNNEMFIFSMGGGTNSEFKSHQVSLTLNTLLVLGLLSKFVAYKSKQPSEHVAERGRTLLK